MVDYKFIQCENPACHLRMPIDMDQLSGKYCPRCGETMHVVADYQSNQVINQDTPVVKRSMVILMDNIRSAYNVGAIIRTADGLGAKKLYLCGITPTPDTSDAVIKTALGAEINIPWDYQPNGLIVAEALKDQGYNLLALEQTRTSIFINDYCLDASDQQAIALVLGNEKAGVDPGIIALCDAVIALPMMGKKSSLNVAVAFGAAAYWLSFT